MDTAKVARRAWERFSQFGYGLANLATEFEIEFQHHRSVEDARAAGLILVRAIRDTGLTLEQWIERAQQPLHGKQSIRAMSGNPDGALAGEVIVFTGSLEMPRQEAARLAAEAGCDVRNSVTNATTVLVIGNQEVRRFNGNDKSAKHRRAEELIRNGSALKIISEADFERLIRN